MAAEIDVQRGTATAANTGNTTAPGTTFGSTASTIVFNSNNRRMHGGRNDENVNDLEGDDMSGGIHLASTSQIDLDRESGSIANTMRFAWESWEYTGSASGNNEFIVRGRYKLTLTGATTTQSVSSISSINDCIPFITGIMTDQATDDADHATAYAYMSGSGTLNVKRGSGSADTVDVYVTVVEFTGSNWQVAHGLLESNADSGSLTIVDNANGTTSGGGDISDWNTAIIYHQFLANALNGTDDAISDTSPAYYPGSGTTSVSWAFHSDHVDSATSGSRNEHFVHVLKHSYISVTRHTDTQSLTGAMNVNISSANLTNLSTSAIEVSRSSSGTGIAYGRGWVNARLTTLTNAELWVHRSGNTISTRIQVINLDNVADIGITDMEDEQIDLGETDNVITGFGFESTQGTGKVELADGPVYATATKVTQTIDSWSATSIQFDSVQGSLSEGTVYLFVTNNSAAVSAGYKVNLGLAPYIEVVNNLNPDHHWTFNNTYNDEINGNSANAVQTGTPSFQTSPLLTRGTTHSLEIDGTTAGEHTEATNSVYMNTVALSRRWMGGWIELDRIFQPPSVLYEEGAQINNLAFVVGWGNVLMAQAADTGDDYVQAYSNFKLAVNRPYHILFKFSASGYDSEFRLYIDGVLQTSTSGNPWTPNDIDGHTGDITWGFSGDNLEVGGTDVAFVSPKKCYYSHWATWSSVALTPTTDIRVDLFEKGALADITLTAGTESTIQTSLNTYFNTTRPDAPLAIKIPDSTSGNFKLFADNIIFNDRVSIQIQYTGNNTLTWVNAGTSNLISSKVSKISGGTVTIIETATITFIVSDNSNNIIPGARVAVYKDSDDTLIINDTTDENGQMQYIRFEYTTDTDIYFRVRRSSNPASFTTTTGVNGTTEVITTSSNHNFEDGEPVVYSKDGGTAVIGLTDTNTYYVNSLTATTISLHTSAANAISDTSRVDLTANGSETHLLTPTRYTQVSGSGTITSTGLDVAVILNEDTIAI